MNHADRYSGLSIVNHWITALLVLAMWLLGYLMHEAPADEIEDFLKSVHVSLGFFALLFILWRVGFRLREGFPPTLGTGWKRTLAWWVHRSILVLLVGQVLTGPLYLFTEGEGVEVFGWFTVYLPMEWASGLHEPAESVHVILGLYVIPAVVLLHVLGAIRHYLRHPRETPADL